ncbi:MAG: DUF2508 family protein [Oscillospiraceae bacterium]
MTIKSLCDGSAKKRKEEAAAERERREILEDIERVTKLLEQNQKSYDLICESELVDASIYEELALKARYAYLLRRAKELDIRCRAVIPR